MKPTHEDQDWEKELTAPPIRGRGFDDELRRRIEDKLDHKEERSRKRFWLYPVLTTCCLLGLSGCLWLASPLWNELHGQALTAAMAPASDPESPFQGEETVQEGYLPSVETPVIKTGVLIGLRLDHDTKQSQENPLALAADSTYRTLMLAPVDGQVQVTAEGSGILVPYGQKFWEIRSYVHQTETDRIQYLLASPADNPTKPVQFIDDPEESLYRSEKLVFAGNKYISVSEQEVLSGAYNRSAINKSNRVWVKTLNQLNDPPLVTAGVGANSGYVTLQDVFGKGAHSLLTGLLLQSKDNQKPPSGFIDGEHWTITRKPGRWIAQAAEISIQSDTQSEDYTLHDYPTELPEIVTSHDTLCCSWVPIKSRQPDTKDLISSPLEDMLVAFKENELVVYAPSSSLPQEGHTPASLDIGQPLLRVKLQPGEQLVSAQWATGGYVDQWVEKTRKYLQPEHTEGR